MGVPKNIFGACRLCGGSGGDAPLTASHRTSADTAPSDTTGNGEKLYSYKGKKICQTCLNEEKSREQSNRTRESINRSEEYRSRAGFSASVS